MNKKTGTGMVLGAKNSKPPISRELSLVQRFLLPLLFCAMAFYGYGAGNPAYSAEGVKAASPEAAALLKKGADLYKNMQFHKAQALLAKAAEKYPAEVEIRYLLGLSAFGSGDYETAANALERVVNKRPGDAVARLHLAETYRKLSENARTAKNSAPAKKWAGLAKSTYATAYEMLKKQAQASPEDLEINNALGKAAMGMQEYPVAVMAFNRVLAANPGNKTARTSLAGAYYRLGLEYLSEGKKSLARENFKKAEDEFATLCDKFTASYKGRRLPAPGMSEYATFSLLYLNLAQSANAAGDRAAATEAYETLLGVNPNDGGTWLQLAELYATAEKTRKAKKAYAEAYRLLLATKPSAPDNIDLIYSLAKAALGAGKNDEAINYYKQMLALDPSRYAAQMALAELYRRQGEPAKADAEYAAVYDKLQQKYLENPNNLGVNYLLARAAMGAGAYDGAVVAYERVLAAKPNLYRVRMDLAAAYLKLDAKAMAEIEFQTIVDESQDAAVTQNAKRWLTALQRAKKRNILFGSLSTSYTRDSNPRSDPVSATISTTGGPGYLDNDLYQKKVDAYNGYTAILRHIYLTPWEPLEWRTTFIWFGTHYHYLDSEDGNYYSIRSGPAARIGKLDVELTALVNAYEKDWETYSKGHGVDLNLLYPFNKHFLLGAEYKLENRKLYQDRDTDVRNHSISLRPVLVWGAQAENRLAFEFNYQAEYNQSGGDYRNAEKTTRYRDTFHALGGGVKYSRKLGWGLTPYVDYNFNEVRYTSRNVLFEDARVDHVHTYGVGITKELPGNFSVDLSHTRIYSFSNSPVDDYRRNLTGVRLMKKF